MNEYTYRVLVAEDEPIILNDTIFEIENAELGFEVKWTAYNGKDALDIIHKEKPDIVFTDIRMPIMSGMEFIENIRKEYPDLPVVVLTGFSQFDYARQAIQFHVEDYLLKPLEADELQTVLVKIKKKLDSERKKNERNIVYSKIHGTLEKQTLPFQYEHDLFELYLIQIGNLYHYDFSEEILERIQMLWSKADWESWMKELCDGRMYWIIDEKKLNQKFLIVEYRRNRKLEERIGFAEKIQEKFQNTVHILLSDSCIAYPDIWNVSGKLRSMSDQTGIGSEILVLGEEKKFESSWFPSDFEKKIRIDIENGNLKGMEEEIEEILEYAEKKKYSQRQIETGILSIYEKMGGTYSSQKENEILRKLRYELFFNNEIQKNTVWKLLEERYLDSNVCGNMEVSIREIEDFILKHYTENITVAELSRKFHFNGNYLTRMFKKYTDESPMNYLIKTRLNRAIELMKTRMDLDIREISILVGYEDSHYFSRIFKNKLGISPSEYRKVIEKDEEN